jgi:hypothetical protein
MDSAAAARLAGQLSAQQQPLCQHVAARMLRVYPELTHSLRIEEGYQPAERLSLVAIERLSELVRAVLVFELPALADSEISWAGGVLPRSGVTRHHVAAMVRLYFEEVRRLPLSPAESELSREIERYFVGAINQAYEQN